MWLSDLIVYVHIIPSQHQQGFFLLLVVMILPFHMEGTVSSLRLGFFAKKNHLTKQRQV